MIQTSEQIGEIAAALVKAQAEIENVEKSASNPAFKRDGQPMQYATLGGALEEVRPKFAKHGVYIMQAAINGDGSNIGVTTRLLHSSGQWIESTLYVAPTRFDAQGAGSVITYLRRYALMAMAGIAPEDDDGNAAVASPQPQPRTNGATRTASAPAAPPAREGSLNLAALPAGPEEIPEVTAARQRVRMLIDKYDRLIKTAPSVHALNLVFEDGQAELREIEDAGEKGKEAAKALREKFMKRIAQLEEAEAA